MLIPRRFLGDVRNLIFEWLSPTIPSASFREALEKRIQATGVWFITSEQFLKWKANADSLLWMHGKCMFIHTSQTTFMGVLISLHSRVWKDDLEVSILQRWKSSVKR